MSSEPVVTDTLDTPVAAERGLVFPGLDTVRAIGALMVMTTHVAFWTGEYSFDVWGTFLSRLDSGVALFFVLSGFLLSRPYIACRRSGLPAPALAGYLWKRALRVLPVYWIAAAAALVFVDQRAGSGIVEWLGVVTLTDLYVADALPAGITQTWSLATEVAFYVTLPALMVLWNRMTAGRRSDLSVVGMTMGALVVSVVWIVAFPQSLADAAPLHHQWLPTFLVWFVVGIALAHVQVHHVEHVDHGTSRRLLAWIPELGRQPGVCIVIAGAVLLAASTPIAGPPVLLPATDLQIVTKTLLYALVGGLVVLAAVYAPAGGVFARLMTHPVSRHLGRISYGVFCIHVLMLHFITFAFGWEQFSGGFVRYLGVTLVLSLLLAELLFRFVERPLSRYRSGAVATTDASRASGSSMRS